MLKTRTRADWVARFNDAGVPCGSVREISEVLADPQLAAREMIAEVQHPTDRHRRASSVRRVKLSDTPPSVRTAPPMLGQHTDAVLDRARLRSAGDRAARKRQGWSDVADVRH